MEIKLQELYSNKTTNNKKKVINKAKVVLNKTYESISTMLEPLLTLLRYEIFTATISASTFFTFFTKPFILLGSSSKLQKMGFHCQVIQ